MIVLTDEIKQKYNILSEEEKITFPEANEFIKDVFKAGWSHPYSFRDVAILRGYAELGMRGSLKKKWLISYKDIFGIMNMPYYKFTPLYEKKSKKRYATKNGFIDWRKK